MEKLSPRFYGRRKGRPLNVRKTALLRDLLPCVQIVLPEKGRIDLATLFHSSVSSPRMRESSASDSEHVTRVVSCNAPPVLSKAMAEGLDSRVRGNDTPLYLEIGFGGGEHLVALAEKNPEAGFIGCEPFVNGVASLLDHVDRRQIANIRIYPDNARHLLDALPDNCLDGGYVLYPDPWPKKRHHERRFINPENLDRLARVLKSGALLHMATDVADLADWMHAHVVEHPSFEIVYDSPDPSPGWTATRYEQKGLKAARKPRYLTGQKR